MYYSGSAMGSSMYYGDSYGLPMGSSTYYGDSYGSAMGSSMYYGDSYGSAMGSSMFPTQSNGTKGRGLCRFHCGFFTLHTPMHRPALRPRHECASHGPRRVHSLALG